MTKAESDFSMAKYQVRQYVYNSALVCRILVYFIAKHFGIT